MPDAVAQLKSPDITKRRVAAQELVNQRNPETAPALMQALSDKDSYVRTLAVRALGYMRYPAAGPKLVDILAKDASKEVRGEAALALRFLNDPSAVPALAQAVKDPVESVRVTAILSLASLRKSAALPALTEAAKDSSPVIRRNAIYAIGQIADPASLDTIKAALKDTDSDVRANAAQALGNMPGKENIAELKELLKDSEILVQLSAARSLAIKGDGSGFDLTLGKANGNPRDVQMLAIDTLGWTRDKRAIPMLESLSKRDDAVIKQAAIQSLARIREKRTT